MPRPTNPITPIVLLSGVTTVSTGTARDIAHLTDIEDRYFTCKVVGTGAVTATVLVEVSNNNTDFFTLATFTLSGTTSATDGCVTEESWQYVRGRISAISGTGAAVTLTLGF
jgi:hypothetical protein